MSGKAQQDSEYRFRFRDFLIILVCLIGVLYFIYLFRVDLFQTINSRNEIPAGIITIKHNTVQRRLRDRMLWDRLRNESPVYLGDIIRVADLSDATLNINSNLINLGENTIIRIRRAVDGTDSFQIDLTSGNLSLAAGTESDITLNIMGRQVQAERGTVLNASAGGDGMKVQVSEGKALFIEENQTREITITEMIALDSAGVERAEPAVSVKFPLPNAYLLKNRPEPLNVDFAWSRYYLRPEQALNLEIAEDRNFSRIVQTIEGLESTARAALGPGQWYWRLSFENTALGTGQITIAQASGPELLTPVMNQQFRYQTIPPALRFQWSKITEASSYILEISNTPDFYDPRIRKSTGVEFSIESDIEEGMWFWRVRPVFPAIFEGNAAFSSISIFRIERGDLPAEPVVPENPEPLAPEVPPPVPVAFRLLAPAQRASIPGLTALRQQTVFRWDSDEAVQKSRFILSRDPDLMTAAVVISNPDRTIRLDRLEEGVWYWTVEGQGENGLTGVAEPQRLTVLPIPLLAAPGSRLPQNTYRFNIGELRKTSAITFRWQAVPNANAYIFTLYQQTPDGRRQIISRAPENRLSWTLDDFSALDGQGTFIWQVEAVNMSPNGTIEQRGTPGENSFIMDIPRAGPVKIEEPGVLYGI